MSSYIVIIKNLCVIRKWSNPMTFLIQIILSSRDLILLHYLSSIFHYPLSIILFPGCYPPPRHSFPSSSSQSFSVQGSKLHQTQGKDKLLLLFISLLIILAAMYILIDGATICFDLSSQWKQMWRHLSIAVVAHKTVVQRVRSNRWRFNFERARTGGQINFLRKTAMIITNTKTSKLTICPFPRGLLLTYPISPPPIRGRSPRSLS